MIPGFQRLGDTIFLKSAKGCSGYESDASIITSFSASASVISSPSQTNLGDVPISSGSSSASFSAPFDPSLHGAHPSDSPDLIILMAWTGANPRHVAKYTTVYEQLFPSSPILLITTSVADMTLRSTRRKVNTLEPAIRYLAAKFAAGTTQEGTVSGSDGSQSSNSSGIRISISSDDSPRILLHAFSDGGSHKTVCLARAYLAATSRPLPVSAAILDSTPGDPHYGTMVSAFAKSIPPPARAVGRPVAAAVVGAHFLFFRLLLPSDRDVITSTRVGLDDAELWGRPGGVGGTARTYIYSEADDMILWPDVERHLAERGGSAGNHVESMSVKFTSSGHCNHARGNEEQYWGAVLKTWETAMTGDSPAMLDSLRE